eukprot:scaffold31512_cov50-Attheya_sp.AAC.1
MDIVATRDIAPGEEIFINYGSEWEEAWTAHSEAYAPTPGSENYISAYEMNDASIPIRTLEEQENNPYPWNVFTVCVHNVNYTWHLLPCNITDRYGPIATVKEQCQDDFYGRDRGKVHVATKRDGLRERKIGPHMKTQQ